MPSTSIICHYINGFLGGKNLQPVPVDPQKHHRAPDSTSPPPLGSRYTRPKGWNRQGTLVVVLNPDIPMENVK